MAILYPDVDMFFFFSHWQFTNMYDIMYISIDG